MRLGLAACIVAMGALAGCQSAGQAQRSHTSSDSRLVDREWLYVPRVAAVGDIVEADNATGSHPVFHGYNGAQGRGYFCMLGGDRSTGKGKAEVHHSDEQPELLSGFLLASGQRPIAMTKHVYIGSEGSRFIVWIRDDGKEYVQAARNNQSVVNVWCCPDPTLPCEGPPPLGTSEGPSFRTVRAGRYVEIAQNGAGVWEIGTPVDIPALGTRDVHEAAAYLELASKFAKSHEVH